MSQIDQHDHPVAPAWQKLRVSPDCPSLFPYRPSLARRRLQLTQARACRYGVLWGLACPLSDCSRLIRPARPDTRSSSRCWAVGSLM